MNNLSYFMFGVIAGGGIIFVMLTYFVVYKLFKEIESKDSKINNLENGRKG